MNQTFSFPQFSDIHSYKSPFSEMGIKFALRRFCFRHWVKQFEDFVNQDADFQEFFKVKKQAYPILYIFVDQRFNAQKRFETMSNDLAHAKTLFGRDLFLRLARFEHLMLADLGEWEIWLNRNDVVSNEGVWAISLRDKAERRIYTLSFAFLNPNQVLLASLQGISDENGREIVKKITKSLFGLRPQQLLVIAAQNLFATWNVRDVLAIAQKNQVKYRFRHKRKMSVDYDGFWQENGAKWQENYWQLPNTPQRKAISEIASKKRSQYQKRYALLDDINAQITNAWQNRHQK